MRPASTAPARDPVAISANTPGVLGERLPHAAHKLGRLSQPTDRATLHHRHPERT
jgi:hypothetical protein